MQPIQNDDRAYETQINTMYDIIVDSFDVAAIFVAVVAICVHSQIGTFNRDKRERKKTMMEIQRANAVYGK